MKKLFLFFTAVVLAFSLNSCSSDSGGGSSLSFKVDGVSKSFKTTVAESGGMVIVSGYTGSAEDPTETFSFSLPPSETGDVMDSPTYTDADGNVYFGNTGSSNVTLNNGSNAKGTFSGTMQSFDPAVTDITVTQGTFNVSY